MYTNYIPNINAVYAKDLNILHASFGAVTDQSVDIRTESSSGRPTGESMVSSYRTFSQDVTFAKLVSQNILMF